MIDTAHDRRTWCRSVELLAVRLRRRRKEQPAAGFAQTLGPSRRVALGKVADRQTPKVQAAWWGIGLCAVIGAALVVVAICQLDANVAEVVASLGTGFLLAGFLLWLEPRLMRKVGETTQRIVDEGTAGLRERIATLETLREGAASDLMDKVREHPDFDSTWELLAEADKRNLFSEDFKVRSGGNREILMEIAISDWPRIMDELMEPIQMDQVYVDILAVSAIEKAHVVASRWWSSESFDDAVNRFWDECQSKEVLTEDIDLAAVFQSLAASYGAMIEARRSPPDTPQKLHGQLRLLVNDEWAITDAGLESRLSNYCSESLGEGREGENRPDGHDADLWDEAAFYAHLLLTPS